LDSGIRGHYKKFWVWVMQKVTTDANTHKKDPEAQSSLLQSGLPSSKPKKSFKVQKRPVPTWSRSSSYGKKQGEKKFKSDIHNSCTKYAKIIQVR